MNRKAVTRELGAAPLSRALAGFIDTEFELARGAFEGGQRVLPKENILRAEQFYRMVVERLEQEFDSKADFPRTGPT
jgi:hypothetical protein